MKFKVGDRVGAAIHGIIEIGEIVSIDGLTYWVMVEQGVQHGFYESELYYVVDSTDTVADIKNCFWNTKPTGGPSEYYDFNPEWETLNDLMDEKAEKQWKEHTHYLHNIMKAAFRWGAKDGTTRGYDARKIIYYSFRILRSLEGREAVQKELKSLQEDTQFKT